MNKKADDLYLSIPFLMALKSPMGLTVWHLPRISCSYKIAKSIQATGAARRSAASADLLRSAQSLQQRQVMAHRSTHKLPRRPAGLCATKEIPLISESGWPLTVISCLS